MMPSLCFWRSICAQVLTTFPQCVLRKNTTLWSIKPILLELQITNNSVLNHPSRHNHYLLQVQLVQIILSYHPFVIFEYCVLNFVLYWAVVFQKSKLIQMMHQAHMSQIFCLPNNCQNIKVTLIASHSTSICPFFSYSRIASSSFLSHMKFQVSETYQFQFCFIGTIFEPLNLGAPTCSCTHSCSCTHCGAIFWYEERLRRDRQTQNPKYNLCCKGGRILLPPYQQPPQPLLSLLTSPSSPLSKHFWDHIRQYNSMFAMTSMVARVIDSVNDGHGPYVFKISGQVCHRIGSLIPTQGARPEYAQLYLFDTENEVSNRMNIVSSSRNTFHVNEIIV
jgi:hypothetical protein